MAGGGGSGGGGTGRWLLTYADLITLLMVFFIVLYAMSETDKLKYAQVARSLNVAFFGGSGVFPGGQGGSGNGGKGELPMPQDLGPQSQGTPPGSGSQPSGTGDALDQWAAQVAAQLQPKGRFHVYTSERGVTISLMGSVLFDSGKATLRPEAQGVLREVARYLKTLPNDISIEGSADDRPIHTPEFPSNWELSARRATEVARFLQQEGVPPERLLVVAYGEFRPIFPNDTPEGRAQNRRVDIVVLREKVSPAVQPGQPVQPKP